MRIPTIHRNIISLYPQSPAAEMTTSRVIHSIDIKFLTVLSDEEIKDEEAEAIEAEMAIERASERFERRRNAPLIAESDVRVMEEMRRVSSRCGAPDWAEDLWLDQIWRLMMPLQSPTASATEPNNPLEPLPGAGKRGVAARASRLFAAPAIMRKLFSRTKSELKFPLFHVPDHLRRFSFSELLIATDQFDYKNFFGRGGCGNVYKGRLADGSLVAVKRYRKNLTTHEGYIQIKTEVEIISKTMHRNLLRLQGFCDTEEKMVVGYPLMVNGSVASHLRERSEAQPPLDWPTRKRIALGSARGLDVLHNHCNPKVIHRDIKAANIFLDANFEAVVGDFGLAKFMDHNDTDVTRAVYGTLGHMPPEYLSTGKISEKVDVFGYGIMLLELITGQRAFDFARLANGYNVMLLDWVTGRLKDNKLETVIDSDLEGNYIRAEVEEMTQLALICTQTSPVNRPVMPEVVKMLQGDGLAERWEDFQNMKISNTSLPEIDLLSVDRMQSDELSGPR